MVASILLAAVAAMAAGVNMVIWWVVALFEVLFVKHRKIDEFSIFFLSPFVLYSYLALHGIGFDVQHTHGRRIHQ